MMESLRNSLELDCHYLDRGDVITNSTLPSIPESRTCSRRSLTCHNTKGNIQKPKFTISFLLYLYDHKDVPFEQKLDINNL